MQIFSSLLYRFNRSCHWSFFGGCFRRCQRWTQKGVLYAYGSRRPGASGNSFKDFFRQDDSPKLKFKKRKLLILICFFYSSFQGSCIKKFNPFCNHGGDGEEMKCTLSNNEDNNIVMCQIWHKMIFYKM